MGGFEALIEKCLHADPEGRAPYITGDISLFFLPIVDSGKIEARLKLSFIFASLVFYFFFF